MDGLVSSFLVRSVVSYRSCINPFQKMQTLVVITVVMILRIWAMYNRSKVVLSTLLAFLFLQMVCILVVAIMYTNQRNITVTSFPPPSSSDIAAPTVWPSVFSMFSFCVVQPNTLIWTKVAGIVQSILSGTMCILAIIQSMRESFQMYRVTKQWQLNRYMRVMTEQGILYFFACVCIHSLTVSNPELGQRLS